MKVLFCDVDELTKKYIKKHKLPKGFEAVLFEKSLNDLTDSDLKPYYKDTAIISPFVYSTLSADLLKNFTKLKLIACRSTGYNNIDLDYCKKHNIKITNIFGYGEKTVAEFAIGTLLNLTRKIGLSFDKLKKGIVNIPEDMGIDLCEKTIGIIGTGSIGAHFAKLVKSFGCQVIAYDIYKNKELEENGILKYTTLDNIFKNSDVISLNCPATKQNYHIINDKTIGKMKDGVYIINTARGSLIDGFALYNNLLSGKIKGAGLDALEDEDIIVKNDINLIKNKDKKFLSYSVINQKLLQLNNVIITPHIAFNSIEANLRILDGAYTNILNFINKKEINSVI